MVKDSEAYKLIISWLSGQLTSYKWIKSRDAFSKKTPMGSSKVILNGRGSYDLSRETIGFELKPYFCLRFDKLHLWLEKHSHKKKSDLRQNCTHLFFLKDLVKDIKEDEITLRTDSLPKLKLDILQKLPTIIAALSLAFEPYKDLESLYPLVIDRLKKDEQDLPISGGVDWIFEMLAMIMIVEPDSFDKYEQILRNNLEVRYQNNEPNASLYFPNYEVIINDLKNSF